MKIQIGVIGSASKNAQGKEKAKQIGKHIAKNNARLLTGACTGLPYEAVKGAKEENGLTIGISPAENRKEHKKKYDYPTTSFDFIIFTGFGYKGRNIPLVRSCDAVIATSGQMGTLNELTIAYGEKKVIGLLKGVPGSSNEFENLANKIGRPGRKIVSSKDTVELVEKVLQKLKETK